VSLLCRDLDVLRPPEKAAFIIAALGNVDVDDLAEW
jgi:hypothetical protein